MASSKAVSRLCARLQPLALKINRKTLRDSFTKSSFQSQFQSQASASATRTFRISRLPVELSSLETIMPLYTAIASARLNSKLSAESQSWALVPQGVSMPL